MPAQSRGPTNPYYYGKAADIDPSYLALIQILQSMMSQMQPSSGRVGPGGSYNPFAWMDEGGLSPDQKRAADEQKQAAEAMQAMQWNMGQSGMRDYLGTAMTPMTAGAPTMGSEWGEQRVMPGVPVQSGPTEFLYQPTTQDVEDWRRPSVPFVEEGAAPSGGSKGSSGGGGGASAGSAGMLTPEMLTAFMKNFQGGGADAGVLESIDKEIQGLRDSMPPEGPEKQAALERITELQATKDKMLSGSGVEGGGMAKQLQDLLAIFAGPRKERGGTITAGGRTLTVGDQQPVQSDPSSGTPVSRAERAAQMLLNLGIPDPTGRNIVEEEAVGDQPFRNPRPQQPLQISPEDKKAVEQWLSESGTSPSQPQRRERIEVKPLQRYRPDPITAGPLWSEATSVFKKFDAALQNSSPRNNADAMRILMAHIAREFPNLDEEDRKMIAEQTLRMSAGT